MIQSLSNRVYPVTLIKREAIMFRVFTLLTATSLLASGPLLAGVEVRFIEGAPKDRFIVKNVGACDLEGAIVNIDLSPSAGQLVFDVAEAGVGVDVFQPLELVDGADALVQPPLVTDGQTFVTLEVATLASGSNISFTIDVDDTIGQREITVSGSEIEGTTVSYVSGAQTSTAVFSTDALANLPIADC